MLIIMILNLMVITMVDKEGDFGIKCICYLAQFTAFNIFRLSYTLEQKYYVIMSIVNRHEPYNSDIWAEKDPEILLWRVGGMIGQCGSSIVGLFDTDMARLCLMGHIMFRTQHAWTDVAIGREDRMNCRRLLAKRYTRLDKSDQLVEKGRVGHVRWDLESCEQNQLYFDVTKNVHRFDPIYKRMRPLHRNILREYAEDMLGGWRELKSLQDTPVTSEVMRKHAAFTIDAGFFGMCKAASPVLLQAIQTDEVEPHVHEAYISFSNYIWYLNLAGHIEEDVAEGVALDNELRAMGGNLQKDVVDRVRVRWLIFAIQEFLKSDAFLFHPALTRSWTLRLFIMQFFRASLNLSEKYLHLLKDGKCKKQTGGSSIFKTFLQNMTKPGYNAAVDNALQYSDTLLERFEAIQFIKLKQEIKTVAFS